MTDHAPMKLEKHYTCFIERRWAGYSPLIALIQLKIVNIDDGSGGSDIGM